MKNKAILSFIIMSAMRFWCMASGDIVLFDSTSHVIIGLPQSPTAVERHAAEELTDYLGRSVGVVPRIDEAGAPGQTQIRLQTVSYSGIKDDSYRLKVNNGSLTITGYGERGVLYGVYAFLERFMGCRWYSVDYKVVPKCNKVTISSDLDLIVQPAFKVREAYRAREFPVQYREVLP